MDRVNLRSKLWATYSWKVIRITLVAVAMVTSVQTLRAAPTREQMISSAVEEPWCAAGMREQLKVGYLQAYLQKLARPVRGDFEWIQKANSMG